MRKSVSVDVTRQDKLACSTTEASLSLTILIITTVGVMLFREQITKMLIRLHKLICIFVVHDVTDLFQCSFNKLILISYSF